MIKNNVYKRNYKLPTKNDGFLWGGSLSAVQVDGIGDPGRSETLQDYLFQKYPEKHWSGIGPSVAIDFTRRYKEDIALYQKIGINSIRYGFQWSRLFPDGKTPNPKAIQLYHDIIDAFKQANIDVIIQLFHFDTPMWIKEQGGWNNELVQKRFGHYARFCFAEYGSKIKRFATFNEPAVMKGIFESPDWWLDGKVSIKRIYKECIGLMMANAHAYYAFQKLKSKGLLNKSLKLGVAVNYNKSYPVDPANVSKADLVAIKYQDAFENRFWTDGFVIGKINTLVRKAFKEQGFVLPITASQERYISKVKLDFIGENYYLPWRAQARPRNELLKKPPTPNFNYYKSGSWKKARMNHFRNWEIFPEGLTGALVDLTNLYGVEIYVAENGMGVDNEEKFRGRDRMIHDEYRIAYIKEHLIAVHNAIKKGANVFGYHVWSITDLWSSYNGFKNRYGLIEVNLDQNLQRSLKKSALWYKSFISEGTIEEDFEKCDKITSKQMEESVAMQKEMNNIRKANYDLIGD